MDQLIEEITTLQELYRSMHQKVVKLDDRLKALERS